MSQGTLTAPDGTEIFYTGIGPEGGTLPAFFYFALSGEESLSLDPYNQPVVALKGAPLRVFSLTLPGHGHGFDKFQAMHFWAEKMRGGDYPIETFLDTASRSIEWLIESGLADPHALALGGLSRGGFIALHLAARDSRIKTVLCFAPLTKLSGVLEFQTEDKRLTERAEALDVHHLAESLTHLKNLRCYIGNRDTRVGTDALYHFIRELADKAHEKRARHCQIELFLTPPLGHQGHGTAPHIFEEGALWVKHHLLK